MRIHPALTTTRCCSFSSSSGGGGCGGSSRRHCCPALSFDLLIQIHEQLHSSWVRKDLLI
jgi:hypothetical protein